MNYVLYLNLWGTTAKLPPPEISPCQIKFAELLAKPPVGINSFCLLDYGYASCASLSPLIEFGQSILREMIFAVASPNIWPVRAAVANGVTLSNGHLSGEGSVRAAELEKSALKGARFFIEKSVTDDITGSRTVMVRGTAHREINWLKDWLDQDRKFRLDQSCLRLMNEGSNYSQQLAASYRDLLRWTSDES